MRGGWRADGRVESRREGGEQTGGWRADGRVESRREGGEQTGGWRADGRGVDGGGANGGVEWWG